MIKVVQVPMFSQNLLMATTEKDLRFYLEEYLGIDVVEDPVLSHGLLGAEGISAEIGLPDGSRLFVMLAPKRNVSCIVHEAVHTAYHILEWVGVTHNADNHEVLSYITQWIFEEFKKPWRKRKNAEEGTVQEECEEAERTATKVQLQTGAEEEES